MNTEELLQKAKIRQYEQSHADAEGDNILNVLNCEFDEAHTHSKIIYYLLAGSERREMEEVHTWKMKSVNPDFRFHFREHLMG